MQYPIKLKMSDGTTKQFWISDEQLQFGGSGGTPTDVQINGVSITDGGVANIPVATQTTPGLVIPNRFYGFYVGSTGYIQGNELTSSGYDSSNNAVVISKGTLENIKNDLVKRSLTDTNRISGLSSD